MVSPVHGDYRRYQAETPLIALSKFPRPALPANSNQLSSKTQFNGVGRLRTYISFTHSAF